MFKKIVVVSAHSDDAEWGCGATIARFLEEGSDIHYVFCALPLTETHEESPMEESIKAIIKLGIKEENIHYKIFPTRHLAKHREKILDFLWNINKELKPNIVFTISTFDTHQDHQVIAEESFRAFKKTCIFGYELFWNTLEFHANGYFTVSKEHLNKKIQTLLTHKTQLFRVFMKDCDNLAKSLAVSRGLQIDKEYAEAFQIRRLII